MKLNNEQLADLQQELNYAVQYKETYDELYDHILTEIDTYDEQPLYAITVAKQIIANDFGGYDALKRMEKDSVKLMTTAMRKKHWQYMLQFFNFPVVIFTAVITIGAYFIALNQVSRELLLSFIAMCAMAPLLYVSFKWVFAAKYRGWYFNDYQKQSVKNNYIFIAAMLSNSLFNLTTFIGHRLETNIAATVIVFVCYMVFVLSFFKLYRDEFKMQLT
jgi:hypothetical protein